MMHAKEVLRRDRLNAIKKGRMEVQLSIAKKMLEEKVDIDFIIRMTGLTKEQIIKL